MPVIGNHEYDVAGAAAYFAYFGAAAGDPAKGYYCFDIGAWHAVVLNSNCTIVSCAAGSAQDTWLRADLAAHPTTCTHRDLPSPTVQLGLTRQRHDGPAVLDRPLCGRRRAHRERP